MVVASAIAGGLFDAQCRGLGDARQALAPVLASRVQVLVRHPRGEVPEGRPCGEAWFGTRAEGVVGLQHLAQDDGHTPPVEEEVVVAPHELVPVVGQPDQCQPDQCGGREVRALVPVLGEVVSDRPLLGVRPQLGEVQDGQGQRDGAGDHGQRLRYALPHDRAAQHLVPREGQPAGPLQRVEVEVALQQQSVLHPVHSGVVGQPGVEEHALLQGGQRVDVLHRGRQLFLDVVEAGLVEGGQGEVGRGVAADLGTAAVRDQLGQDLDVALRQPPYRLLLVHLTAVRPGHFQSAARDAAVDVDEVGAVALGRPGAAE